MGLLITNMEQQPYEFEKIRKIQFHKFLHLKIGQKKNKNLSARLANCILV